MRYKCIKEFSVDEYDDDGFYTGKTVYVDAGTIWEENSHRDIIGGDIHLDQIAERYTRWVEIARETLAMNFAEIKGKMEGR